MVSHILNHMIRCDCALSILLFIPIWMTFGVSLILMEWDTPGMLHAGVVGHNTENITTNHSGLTCWEGCHVPCRLTNPAMVFYCRSNLCTLSQEAKLHDPTHLSLFPNLSTPFVISSSFKFILSSISCSSPGYS